MRSIYSTRDAILGCKILDEDDDLVFDYEYLLGAAFITGLRSNAPGDASKLLTKFCNDLNGRIAALVAHAESGDHERLRKLYERFGFVSINPNTPSLMIRR